MSSDATGEVGHCKDVEHVRVVYVPGVLGTTRGAWRAQFVASASCVNVPDYDGWVVQLQRRTWSGEWADSLRLLPGLADVLPAWLRRVRRQAAAHGGAVNVEHTFDKQWKVLVTLSPDAARELARLVQRAAAQGPMAVDA